MKFFVATPWSHTKQSRQLRPFTTPPPPTPNCCVIAVGLAWTKRGAYYSLSSPSLRISSGALRPPPIDLPSASSRTPTSSCIFCPRLPIQASSLPFSPRSRHRAVQWSVNGGLHVCFISSGEVPVAVRSSPTRDVTAGFATTWIFNFC